MATWTIESFLTYLDTEIAEQDGALKAFKKAFTKDPNYALEWSATAFSAAARWAVARHIRMALTPPTKATLATLREYVADRVSHMWANPTHSSSPTANLIAQETCAAWAKLLRTMEQG